MTTEEKTSQQIAELCHGDLLAELSSLREQNEKLRKQVVALSKGDPEAAELVLARIVAALDKHIDEGVWPEKVEMAIDGLALEVKQANARADALQMKLDACFELLQRAEDRMEHDDACRYVDHVFMCKCGLAKLT